MDIYKVIYTESVPSNKYFFNIVERVRAAILGISD